MGVEKQSGFKRKARVYFRRLRITLLLISLGLLVGFIYLNRSGVPEFIQRPLLSYLRDRGISLEFRKLRFRWYRGLVADNVRLGHAIADTDLNFTANSADLKLDFSALLTGRVIVDTLAVHDGRLAWGMGDTNTELPALVIDRIESRLRLLPDDRWILDDFRAHVAGAQFYVTGQITNASGIRGWRMPPRREGVKEGTMRERLHLFLERLETVSFGARPELRLHFDGDGRDPRSFAARLALRAPDATTQWGCLTNAFLVARMFAADSNSPARVEANFDAGRSVTRWGDLEGLSLHLQLGSPPGRTNQFDAWVRARARRAVSPWLESSNLQFTAQWRQTLREVVPLAGQLEFVAEGLVGKAGGMDRLKFIASLAEDRSQLVSDPGWSWWTNLAPYRLEWQTEINGLRSEQLSAGQVIAAGNWHSPLLAITNFHADLKDGPLKATGQLDVASREATLQVQSDFDIQQIRPLLREKARVWLGRHTWGRQPPHLIGNGAVVLPAWTNRHPDWRGEVLPTLRIAAELTVTNGAFLGIPASWMHTHIRYTNMVWHLPDLRAGNERGLLELEHIADDRTRDYVFHFRSITDPWVLYPLLSTNAQRGLDYFALTGPPVLEGSVWGRWRALDRIGFHARVVLTNFSFREQSFDHVGAELRYTNRFLEILQPSARRAGTQTASAAGVGIDFDALRAYFTNGYSTTDPLVAARCIGPKTAKGLEPYLFHEPPVVRVEGYVPLKGTHDADLRCLVDGGRFSWWRFHVPQIAGQVHWRGDNLELSDMKLPFYEGRAEGQARFVFEKPRGTDFQFFMNVTNVSLQRLMPDLFGHTNKLEGLLSGSGGITNANTADPHSWNGWSHFKLRDGLIWDIPIFGLFSEPLDTIVPGLGRSRLSEATGKVGITNSIMHFEKVEMRAPVMRLQFRGVVDFEGNVNAIAEAEPLRDTWIVGPLMSLALKPMTKFFEYRVTGTLAKPRKEPLYFPARLLFIPFHPFQTLEDLFTPSSPETKAPMKREEP